ncbi:MAG: type II toxin-antitoxin system RelE/ParE family toxin [Planctomycetaceae bacterium]
MKNFTISPRAKADLDEIWTYLAEHAERSVADRVLRQIKKTIRMVGRQPEIGSRVGDRSPGLRFVMAGKYAVLYENQTRFPQIRRVMHGARDLSEYFGTDAEVL